MEKNTVQYRIQYRGKEYQKTIKLISPEALLVALGVDIVAVIVKLAFVIGVAIMSKVKVLVN